MSSPAQADRNLLGGVLALQMDFVTGGQLLAAMNTWAMRKDTPLLDLLHQDGVLAGEDREALVRLVERHVARHGDARKSLASLHLDSDVRRELEQIKNTDVQDGLDSMRTTVPYGKTPDARSGGGMGHDSGWPGFARFRRVRSHAKGGLGEVWLAEDAELHREVALKEIQERFADSEDSRTRFIREAEITGQLEHPGIVPIYGLGVYGDGRPYYAMRFIRGESMQEAIGRFHESDRAGKRDPGERALALRGLLGRFVAVCNAVGFAHARGIMHRDLKPANVMLGEYGETLVVDWGLARRLTEADDCTVPMVPVRLTQDDAGQTGQGQAVGTPGFMPPEQALGDLDRVGARSDVFALGATLYALLSGKSPYVGPKALADAAEGKFPPPRQVNAAVPAALEAVCLEAMAHRPEDRYAGARELAAEVDRWLANEPVSVFREPLGVRAARWARRNRTLVSSLLVLLLASVTGLSVGLFAVGREQVKTAGALKTAEDNLVRAVTAEEAAKGNLDRAEENLKLARKAVDECFSIAKGHPRLQDESLMDVKKLLLEKALPFYSNFRVQRPNDAQLDADTAGNLLSVAYITSEISGKKEALASYEQARELYRKLVTVQPDVLEHQSALARTHHNMGNLQNALGKRKEALESHQQARDIQSKLAANQPDITQYQSDLAATYNCLAGLLSGSGKPTEALKLYQQARDIQSKLAAAHPNVLEYQNGLAGTHNNLGNLLDDLGKRGEALECYKQACDIQGKLVTAQPNVADYQSALGLMHNNRAILLRALGKPGEALKSYHLAREIEGKLVAAQPNVSQYQSNLGRTHHNLAVLLRSQGKREEALQSYRLAREIRGKLATAQPHVWEYHYALANTHNNMAVLLFDMGKLEEALNSFLEARKTTGKRATAAPEDGETRKLNANVHYHIARTHALIAAQALRDTKKPLAVREMEAEKAALEAIRCLEQAKGIGAFEVPQIRQRLLEDPYLDGLRKRDDFQKLVKGLPEPAR